MTPPVKTLLPALVLFLAAPLAAAEFSGIIAFGDCAEDRKVTEKAHASCAKGKDRDYQVLVFYDYKKKKILELIDEEQVEEFLGKSVAVQGVEDAGFLIYDRYPGYGNFLTNSEEALLIRFQWQLAL